MADRKPGLAGAGRAFGEYQLIFAQGGQILVLRGAAGAHDAALARFDDAKAVLGGVLAREEKPLIGALGDDALDIPFACRLTLFDTFVQHLEHAPRLLARLARAFDDDLVSVGVGRHAEPALDARDVLIVMAKDDRGGGVVGESDGDFGRFQFAKRRIDDRRSGGDTRWRRVLRLQIVFSPLCPVQVQNHPSRQ